MRSERWSCRRAGVADAAVLAGLLHAFNTEFVTPVPSVEVLTGRFERLVARDDVVVLLSEQDGTGVGFAFTTVRASAYCDAGVALLEELYVRPDLRGRGLGAALMDALLAELTARGVDELQVGVDSVDVDACRFYVRHGFSNDEESGGVPSQMLMFVREV